MRQATSFKLSASGRLAGGTALAAGQFNAVAKFGQMFLHAVTMITLDLDCAVSDASAGACEPAQLNGQFF